MGKNSAIEWTDATWNPWYGCTKVSEGCKNCYALRDMERFGKPFNKITKSKTKFRDPLKWKEPLKIFVCSWGDFFHPNVPKEWRQDAWEIMFHAKEHTFLILTKRPENMIKMMPVGWIEGQYKYMPNIWLGVSTENQARADERIPILLEIPAAIHFISAEPLLGPLSLQNYLRPSELRKTSPIDWVIVGGESGPNHRPPKLQWITDLRDQCAESQTPFFYKQFGGNKKIDGEWGDSKNHGTWGGRLLEGRTYDEMPEANIVPK